ncbi:translation initiation factor IF-2-like [Vidua chalybeata]|uniref:translation initiation factor IF-2-like n=1 Tax=Vidua chalybeata TaxID=81927 RepID=UPI0023A88734|nr:translation initiation factor IF-2-like [Vidua chalybeata]
MRVGERAAPRAGKAEPSRAERARAARVAATGRTAGPAGRARLGEHRHRRGGGASPRGRQGAPLPRGGGSAPVGARALRVPRQGPAPRHRNYRNNYRNYRNNYRNYRNNYRNYREGARDVPEQKPEGASSNPPQPGEAVAKQSCPDNKPPRPNPHCSLAGSGQRCWRAHRSAMKPTPLERSRSQAAGAGSRLLM